MSNLQTNLDLAKFDSTPDNETHWVCSFYPEVSLCGKVDKDYVEHDDDVTSCVVCEDLVKTNFCPVKKICNCSND